MREWDAQCPTRQQVILCYIQREVKKLRGIDNTTRTEIFANPFNNNLDDLKDLGIQPDDLLQNLTNQRRRSADECLSTDELLYADEAQYPNSPMRADDPVDEADPTIECLPANEYSANDVDSSNSTLPSVHKLLLPSAKSKVGFRSIERTITN